MLKSVLKQEKQNQSKSNLAALDEYGRYYEQSRGGHTVKLENFPKYVSREAITRFLARQEIFLKQLNVCGSIVELGVGRGGSLMSWAQLSSIYEPANYTRKIIGFDTFGGFPQIDKMDRAGVKVSEQLRPGGLAVEEGMKEDIEKAVQLWDMTRYLNHIAKVTLIKGNILKTLPAYVEENPHLVVSLLHLDADLYEPTKLGLELLLPRMPKGAVLLFDELNMEIFPGETIAVLEAVGIVNLKIERMTYAPNISYAVIE